MNYIEKTLSEISRIKEIVENWKSLENVSEIERKIVKDYLAHIYESLCVKPVSEMPDCEKTEVVIEKKEEKIETEKQEKTEVEKQVEIVLNTVKPEQKQEQPTIVVAHTDTDSTPTRTVVLGESLQKSKRFLSDDFNEKDDVLLTPIENLSKGIGLNDKFLFSKELFGGNSQKFNTTIDVINVMNSFEDAMIYIQEHFSWSSSNPVAKHFMTLVRRRFM
ncbi:MAG: hypothetical protein LBT56_07900 [Prevotellaceae bacterium]|jgi:hypothetical protein|nr:hypothetical protein [Prevotellaceae bacterium]